MLSYAKNEIVIYGDSDDFFNILSLLETDNKELVINNQPYSNLLFCNIEWGVFGDYDRYSLVFKDLTSFVINIAKGDSWTYIIKASSECKLRIRRGARTVYDIVVGE